MTLTIKCSLAINGICIPIKSLLPYQNKSNLNLNTLIIEFMYCLQEHHLQRAISGTGLIIPTPEVCEVSDLEFYERCYPPDYKMPKQHIHMQREYCTFLFDRVTFCFKQARGFWLSNVFGGTICVDVTCEIRSSFRSVKWCKICTKLPGRFCCFLYLFVEYYWTIVIGSITSSVDSMAYHYQVINYLLVRHDIVVKRLSNPSSSIGSRRALDVTGIQNLETVCIYYNQWWWWWC